MEDENKKVQYHETMSASFCKKHFLVASTVVGFSWTFSCTAQVRQITCFSDVFAPFVTQDGAEIRGIDVDAVAEAGRRVGIEVRFKVLPWVRLERQIELGAKSDVDCAFAYTLTAARKTHMDFTTVPLKLTELIIFAKRGRFDNFKGIEDLRGKSIGIRRGFKVPAALQVLVNRGDVVLEEINGDLPNFKKLERDRLDAILSNREVGLQALEGLGVTDIIALSPSVQTTPTYLVLNKGKNLLELVSLFDKGFKSILADGTYRIIRDRYLQPAADGSAQRPGQ